MQYDLAKNFITSDEQEGALGALTVGMGSLLALIGCLHVAISIYLCYAFLRPLWRADRLGGGDPARACRYVHRGDIDAGLLP